LRLFWSEEVGFDAARAEVSIYVFGVMQDSYDAGNEAHCIFKSRENS